MKATMFFCLVTLAGTCLYAQDSRLKTLGNLIAAENGFAELAQKTNFANAFLQNLDSAGIVFKGAEPVNGLSFYHSVPVNNELLFKWYPVHAELAGKEDLGFTTGPYILISNKSHDTLAAGNYFSIWQKNASGIFKVLLDGGINHSNNGQAADYGKLPSATAAGTGMLPAGMDNKNSLAPTDEKFIALAGNNLLQAYDTYMADRCYLLRADMPPGMDKAGNLQTLKKLGVHSCRFAGKGTFYSAGNSWCFTYGTVQPEEKTSNKNRGYFVHVWQYQPGGWKIIADVLQFVRNN